MMMISYWLAALKEVVR
jgi:hypothetical protein